ncbi:hypothetical protein CA13_24740 [Planctomycetes bacterium CA13]|uniref:Uncharacterized protein n=1 Tax=Novipirellula herctigrandis TaxID=2527986 RepID=A0A5C5Z256_9BACT|nr:hypothetical protein CA13_24740 [Planctomycetes bacterium CA13]
MRDGLAPLALLIRMPTRCEYVVVKANGVDQSHFVIQRSKSKTLRNEQLDCATVDVVPLH